MSFRYGLVRARIRLPRGRGIWLGFWLLGENIDEVGWPQCGEIDVIENSGANPAVVYGTAHGPGYSGAGGITAALHVGSPLADDFHVYPVSWEPGRIRWYVAEKPYHTVTRADLRGNPWVFDHDFFLLVNVAPHSGLRHPSGWTTHVTQRPCEWTLIRAKHGRHARITALSAIDCGK